ncbi:MAG: hypothetical protein OC190_16335 [Novosphingobium aromaticivorans]|nr:hypothetical protein [Novosphingobium aromaticivorans]
MRKSPEAYLAATRRLRDEFIPHGYYAQLRDRIRAAMGGFAPLPDLHVTYSTERTCETLELADGRVIIYDQYLGQTFNQLNRLHLNGRDPNDMTTYGCKLLAERLQLIGCLEQSLALAATYRIRQHEAVNGFREDRDLKQRLQWTLIQESFVVVHELFHNVLHRDRAWRADAIRDARGDFYTNRLLPQTQRALTGDEDADYCASLARQITLFLNSDALVEECVCDTLAVPVIWLMYRGQCDVATIRSAIFFAVRNLRLLTIISHYGDLIRSGDTEADINGDYLTPYLLRTSFLQWMMQQFEPFSSVVSSSANDEPFMVEQSRYETLIADPVYEDLWHLTQRLRASRLAAPDYSAVGAINSKIDALIGNARLRAPIEARGEAYFIHDLSALDATEVEAHKREFLNAVDAEDEFFPQALDGTDHFTISPCDADGRSNPTPNGASGLTNAEGDG